MAAANFSGADTGIILEWDLSGCCEKLRFRITETGKVNDDQTMLVKMQKECNRRGAMTQTTSRERTGE